MIFCVVSQYRAVSHRHSEWWWFFSIPDANHNYFSVWWKPDGTKTKQQFLEEQVKLVLEYFNADSSHSTPSPSHADV